MSSFLRELPEELLHWITPKVSARRTFASSSYETNSYVNAFANLPSPASGRGAGGEGLWRIGQRVFHQKFGEGVVTDTEGSSNEGRVQANFKRAGS